jgi:thiamine biosynthesis protein ThiC
MEIKDKTTAIEEIAMGIAGITLDLMEDSVDWQLEDFPQNGDDYNTIHTAVMKKAIEFMYLQTKMEYR